MSKELAVVQGAYAAFAAGDVVGVLGALADTVRWVEAEGGPYGGLYVGPEAVLEGVFARIGADWDRFTAVPAEFVVQGATVVALGEYSATYKATGKSFRAPFAHVWKLEGGKVVSFHQHTDTEVHRRPLS